MNVKVTTQIESKFKKEKPVVKVLPKQNLTTKEENEIRSALDNILPNTWTYATLKRVGHQYYIIVDGVDTFFSSKQTHNYSGGQFADEFELWDLYFKQTYEGYELSQQKLKLLRTSKGVITYKKIYNPDTK